MRPGLVALVTAMALAVSGVLLRSSRLAAQASAPGAPSATQGLTIQGSWVQAAGEVQSTYSLENGFSDAHAKIGKVDRVKRSVVIDPPDGRIPFQPWALKVREAREAVHEDMERLTSKNLDGRAKCYPAGIPRIATGAGLISITRFPDRVTMQTEFAHQYRVI